MSYDSRGVRRKDTTKGPPLRILSLDGGGVRGYSMLILLQELMHRTYVEIHGKAPKRHETPRPCEHFDLIAGTGTGGLIAIMLGRLRLDIETCKDVYVRMTKRVFETDKRIAGIPYRGTLFKASKLEEAIRECVQQHTVSEAEGNDSYAASTAEFRPPMTPGSAMSAPTRTASNASRYSQIGATPTTVRNPLMAMRFGNPNALLYDERENRTKTAVTAVYKGTPKGGSAVLLRSYDSRKEPAPEFNCTIWQAGRATSATGLAFKPIQIGQSVFIDEGAGKYNPAPQILDEAVCAEWPGREVGVFISIGTGKRPRLKGQLQHEWWEGLVGSGMGDFAEAKRRLLSKIDGCEDTHEHMLKDHLSRRNVNPEAYYRLNVDVGVGEFEMNEWNRLAEISTNTRKYLSDPHIQNMNLDMSAKIARIHFAKERWDRRAARSQNNLTSNPGGGEDMDLIRDKTQEFKDPAYLHPSNPLAVELPAEQTHPQQQQQLLSPSAAQHPSPRISSDEFPQPVNDNNGLPPPPTSDPTSTSNPNAPARRPSSPYRVDPYPAEGRSSNGSFIPTPPPRRSHEYPEHYVPGQYPPNVHHAHSFSQQSAQSHHSYDYPAPLSHHNNNHSQAQAQQQQPPPLPPKSPIRDQGSFLGGGRESMLGRESLVLGQGGPGGQIPPGPPGGGLPYPEDDGPPVVNMSRKPEFGVR